MLLCGVYINGLLEYNTGFWISKVVKNASLFYCTDLGIGYLNYGILLSGALLIVMAFLSGS